MYLHSYPGDLGDFEYEISGATSSEGKRPPLTLLPETLRILHFVHNHHHLCHSYHQEWPIVSIYHTEDSDDDVC